MCEKEPGLFRKGEMRLALWVDDSLLTGPNLGICTAEMEKILEMFPGKVVPPKLEGNWEVRDLLGATLRYNRTARLMKIDVAEAIERALTKFNLGDAKPAPSPGVRGSLEEGPVDETFPLRSLVGSLLYIATICRPDVMFATNRVARAMKSPHASCITAAKRVLLYLKGTSQVGLEYSSKNELRFRLLFGKYAKDKVGELPLTVAFCDADLGGDEKSFKSTSGIIVYHRGTPISWAAKNNRD